MPRMSKKEKAFRDDLQTLYDTMMKRRNCGNADHLTDENGAFKSDMPHKKGEVSIAYLEDVCQWLYYHNNLTREEKLERILKIEAMIQDLLGGPNNIRYIPYWSARL